jgi:hypothetical protein
MLLKDSSTGAACEEMLSMRIDVLLDLAEILYRLPSSTRAIVEEHLSIVCPDPDEEAILSRRAFQLSTEG